MPANSRNRLPGMTEFRIFPKWRRRRGRRVKKAGVLRIRNLGSGQQKTIGPDAVDWAFRILPRFRAHQEPSCGNIYESWYWNRLGSGRSGEFGRKTHVVAACGLQE